MVVIVSGPSGSGKTTVINQLLKSGKFKFFKSATSRPRREGEPDHHYFITEEEFLERIKRGEFFEYEEVHGLHYGVLWKEINDIIADKKYDYIRDIEVKGNVNLRKYLDGKTPYVSIFLDAPDDVLYQRLIARGESEERARIRLQRNQLERQYKNHYDAVIENIDLDKTVKAVAQAIEKYRKLRQPDRV